MKRYNNTNNRNSNNRRNTGMNRNRNNVIKDVLLSFKGKTIKFRFKISKQYDNEYRIYILHTPKDMTIYGAHMAHYLTEGNSRYICWDGRIKSFKDANAVMFVWARNFRDNCLRR